MRNRIISACLLFLGSAICASAQATGAGATDVPPAVGASSTFSLSAQAIALPGNHQTVAGTIVGAKFGLSSNLALRSDNLLVPASDLQGYFGGFDYVLPAISNKIQNTSSTLDGNHLQIYLTASAGIDRIAPAVGPSFQHYAFLAGGGLRYDPMGSKNFSINVEVRYAKLPGYANSTVIVAASPTLRF